MSAARVDIRVRLSRPHTERLRNLAVERNTSEAVLVERALDVLFYLMDSAGSAAEPADWSMLSEVVLNRVWDNDKDAIYDNWREFYGIPSR
jgi:hypothetical protein